MFTDKELELIQTAMLSLYTGEFDVDRENIDPQAVNIILMKLANRLTRLTQETSGWNDAPSALRDAPQLNGEAFKHVIGDLVMNDEHKDAAFYDFIMDNGYIMYWITPTKCETLFQTSLSC